MAQISVEPTGANGYRVTVAEGSSTTSHDVTCTEADCRRFGGDTPAAALIAESFRFLLEREPKESILRQFELSVIGRYFPEYPSQIRSRLL